MRKRCIAPRATDGVVPGAAIGGIGGGLIGNSIGDSNNRADCRAEAREYYREREEAYNDHYIAPSHDGYYRDREYPDD